MPVTTTRATLDDVDDLAPLFDAYRQFYDQPADLALARDFIGQRLQRSESTLFIARDDYGRALGFTQLFPMFSSVRAARTWVLNDLYVDPDARRHHVGTALLDAAAQFARSGGAIRLELETMPDNRSAQSLYRAQGWQQYDGTLRFHLPLAERWQDE